MATVPLDRVAFVVTPEIAKQIRLATREAVNKSALEITQDARERVNLAIGPERRLSGSKILFSWTVEKPGTDSRRVRKEADPRGRRINPAYKQADSVTKPTALIGARGPAQWIEHDRKGPYKEPIRPRRSRATSDKAVADLDRLQQEIFGTPSSRGPTSRLKHAPALSIGGKFYGAAKGGSILRPRGGPITGAMRAAPRTVQRLAERVLAERMARTMASF